MHPDRGLAQKVSHARRRIPPSAIDQPFIADRLVALDQLPEKALHFRMSVYDRVEVFGAADHHLASDNRLNPVSGESVAGENAFACKAQRDDLPSPGRIGLKLGQDTGPDEHHFVARRTDLTEGPTRLDLDDPVRHLVEK